MEVKTHKQPLNLKHLGQVLLSALIGGLVGLSFGGKMFIIFLCALSATTVSVWRLRISRSKS